MYSNLWIFIWICLFESFSMNNSIDISANQNESMIFGVRWFLGEKFRFQRPIGLHSKKQKQQQQQSHLVLFFNSEKNWENYVFTVVIEQKKYKCSTKEVRVKISSNHHQKFNQFASNVGDQLIHFIYKCPILFQDSLFLEKVSKFGYEITAEGFQLKMTLAKATLRSPAYNLSKFSITTFGDWGKMTSFSSQSNKSVPIDRCLSQKIKKDEKIRIMLLLGDLAYDIEGKSYFQFMKYLQKYSRQIVLLFSPGNHETIKHKDIFQLAKQSFYSPSWNYFYGYFDLVKLGNYLFLGANTEQYFWDGLAVQSNSSLFTLELEKQYGSFQRLFKMQFTEQLIIRIRKQFKVIGYSHYPIYCSEEDRHEKCSLYHDRHSEILSIYRELGMQLYFSGHLHVYERSKQICQNGTIFEIGTKIEETLKFSQKGDCSIFIIEGAAGNNYYVETQRHFPLKNYSGAFVNNTGFGVLQLSSNELIFQHISISDSCLVADRIIVTDEKDEFIIEIESDGSENRLLYVMQICLGLIGLIVAASVLWRKKIMKKKEAQKLAQRSMENVAQFVQLNFA